jgi:hypothetical protein
MSQALGDAKYWLDLASRFKAFTSIITGAVSPHAGENEGFLLDGD